MAPLAVVSDARAPMQRLEQACDRRPPSPFALPPINAARSLCLLAIAFDPSGVVEYGRGPNLIGHLAFAL
jgi:hypothetical protein